MGNKCAGIPRSYYELQTHGTNVVPHVPRCPMCNTHVHCLWGSYGRVGYIRKKHDFTDACYNQLRCIKSTFLVD